MKIIVYMLAVFVTALANSRLSDYPLRDAARYDILRANFIH